MGAEASILQELDFDEDPELLTESVGSGFPSGARLKDGKRVSVFMYDKGTKEPDLFDNAAKVNNFMFDSIFNLIVEKLCGNNVYPYYRSPPPCQNGHTLITTVFQKSHID